MSSFLVVFDIGNVLLRFSPERARRNFDALDPGCGNGLVEFLWRSRSALDFERGRLTGRDLYSRARKRVGMAFSYTDFLGAFNDIFDPIAENLSLLEETAALGPTALLSNVNPLHWRHVMGRYPELKAARWPLGSHRLGYVKPDPRIYHALARRTRVPFEKMVYVDDRKDFIAVARGLGMRGVHFTGRRSLRLDFERLGVL
jgi:putative hydrolase of the HAD superfamily